MKFKNYKLRINTAIVCIMLLTSGAAMAEGCDVDDVVVHAEPMRD